MEKILPKVALPPTPPATRDEIARRRQVVEKIRKLRDEIGPIGLRVEELLDDDAEDDG
ncbi:MAG: hypothetical protein ACRDIY_01815 [Chloroflexota bacterium]